MPPKNTQNNPNKPPPITKPTIDKRNTHMPDTENDTSFKEDEDTVTDERQKIANDMNHRDKTMNNDDRYSYKDISNYNESTDCSNDVSYDSGGFTTMILNDLITNLVMLQPVKLTREEVKMMIFSRRIEVTDKKVSELIIYMTTTYGNTGIKTSVKYDDKQNVIVEGEKKGNQEIYNVNGETSLKNKCKTIPEADISRVEYNSEGNIKNPIEWGYKEIVTALKDSKAALNWMEIYTMLDHNSLRINSLEAFYLVIDSWTYINGHNTFPYHLFLNNTWKNRHAQNEFLLHLIDSDPLRTCVYANVWLTKIATSEDVKRGRNTDQDYELRNSAVINRSTTPVSKIVNPNFKTYESTSKIVNSNFKTHESTFNCIELFRCLVFQNHTYLIERISSMSPEWCLLGLSYIDQRANKNNISPYFIEMSQKLFSDILRWSPNVVPVIHLLFSNDRFKTVDRMADVVLKKQPNTSLSCVNAHLLSKVLDIILECKMLSFISEIQINPDFCYEVVMLASRRDHLNLRLWIRNMQKRKGDAFVKSFVKYFERKLKASSNTNKANTGLNQTNRPNISDNYKPQSYLNNNILSKSSNIYDNPGNVPSDISQMKSIDDNVFSKTVGNVSLYVEDKGECNTQNINNYYKIPNTLTDTHDQPNNKFDSNSYLDKDNTTTNNKSDCDTNRNISTHRITMSDSQSQNTPLLFPLTLDIVITVTQTLDSLHNTFSKESSMSYESMRRHLCGEARIVCVTQPTIESHAIKFINKVCGNEMSVIEAIECVKRWKYMDKGQNVCSDGNINLGSLGTNESNQHSLNFTSDKSSGLVYRNVCNEGRPIHGSLGTNESKHPTLNFSSDKPADLIHRNVCNEGRNRNIKDDSIMNMSESNSSFHKNAENIYRRGDVLDHSEKDKLCINESNEMHKNSNYSLDSCKYSLNDNKNVPFTDRLHQKNNLECSRNDEKYINESIYEKRKEKKDDPGKLDNPKIKFTTDQRKEGRASYESEDDQLDESKMKYQDEESGIYNRKDEEPGKTKLKYKNDEKINIYGRESSNLKYQDEGSNIYERRVDQSDSVKVNVNSNNLKDPNNDVQNDSVCKADASLNLKNKATNSHVPASFSMRDEWEYNYRKELVMRILSQISHNITHYSKLIHSDTMAIFISKLIESDCFSPYMKDLLFSKILEMLKYNKNTCFFFAMKVIENCYEYLETNHKNIIDDIESIKELGEVMNDTDRFTFNSDYNTNESISSVNDLNKIIHDGDGPSFFKKEYTQKYNPPVNKNPLFSKNKEKDSQSGWEYPRNTKNLSKKNQGSVLISNTNKTINRRYERSSSLGKVEDQGNTFQKKTNTVQSNLDDTNQLSHNKDNNNEIYSRFNINRSDKPHNYIRNKTNGTNDTMVELESENESDTSTKINNMYGNRTDTKQYDKNKSHINNDISGNRSKNYTNINNDMSGSRTKNFNNINTDISDNKSMNYTNINNDMSNVQNIYTYETISYKGVNDTNECDLNDLVNDIFPQYDYTNTKPDINSKINEKPNDTSEIERLFDNLKYDNLDKTSSDLTLLNNYQSITSYFLERKILSASNLHLKLIIRMGQRFILYFVSKSFLLLDTLLIYSVSLNIEYSLSCNLGVLLGKLTLGRNTVPTLEIFDLDTFISKCMSKRRYTCCINFTVNFLKQGKDGIVFVPNNVYLMKYVNKIRIVSESVGRYNDQIELLYSDLNIEMKKRFSSSTSNSISYIGVYDLTCVFKYKYKDSDDNTEDEGYKVYDEDGKNKKAYSYEKMEDNKAYYNENIKDKNTFYKEKIEDNKGYYDGKIKDKKTFYNEKIEDNKGYYDDAIKDKKTLCNGKIENNKMFYDDAIRHNKAFYDERMGDRKDSFNSEELNYKSYNNYNEKIGDNKRFYDEEVKHKGYQSYNESKEYKFSNIKNKVDIESNIDNEQAIITHVICSAIDFSIKEISGAIIKRTVEIAVSSALELYKPFMVVEYNHCTLDKEGLKINSNGIDKGLEINNIGSDKNTSDNIKYNDGLGKDNEDTLFKNNNNQRFINLPYESKNNLIKRKELYNLIQNLLRSLIHVSTYDPLKSSITENISYFSKTAGIDIDLSLVNEIANDNITICVEVVERGGMTKVEESFNEIYERYIEELMECNSMSVFDENGSGIVEHPQGYKEGDIKDSDGVYTRDINTERGINNSEMKYDNLYLGGNNNSGYLGSRNTERVINDNSNSINTLSGSRNAQKFNDSDTVKDIHKVSNLNIPILQIHHSYDRISIPPILMTEISNTKNMLVQLSKRIPNKKLSIINYEWTSLLQNIERWFDSDNPNSNVNGISPFDHFDSLINKISQSDEKDILCENLCQCIIGYILKHTKHREIMLFFLHQIFYISFKTGREVISWFIYGSDERKFSIDLVDGFVRYNLINLNEYDQYLARNIRKGYNNKDISNYGLYANGRYFKFALQILTHLTLNDVKPCTPYDFIFTIECLSKSNEERHDERIHEILSRISSMLMPAEYFYEIGGERIGSVDGVSLLEERLDDLNRRDREVLDDRLENVSKINLGKEGGNLNRGVEDRLNLDKTREKSGKDSLFYNKVSDDKLDMNKVKSLNKDNLHYSKLTEDKSDSKTKLNLNRDGTNLEKSGGDKTDLTKVRSNVIKDISNSAKMTNISVNETITFNPLIHTVKSSDVNIKEMGLLCLGSIHLSWDTYIRYHKIPSLYCFRNITDLIEIIKNIDEGEICLKIFSFYLIEAIERRNYLFSRLFEFFVIELTSKFVNIYKNNINLNTNLKPYFIMLLPLLKTLSIQKIPSITTIVIEILGNKNILGYIHEYERSYDIYMDLLLFMTKNERFYEPVVRVFENMYMYNIEFFSKNSFYFNVVVDNKHVYLKNLFNLKKELKEQVCIPLSFRSYRETYLSLVNYLKGDVNEKIVLKINELENVEKIWVIYTLIDCLIDHRDGMLVKEESGRNTDLNGSGKTRECGLYKRIVPREIKDRDNIKENDMYYKKDSIKSPEKKINEKEDKNISKMYKPGTYTLSSFNRINNIKEKKDIEETSEDTIAIRVGKNSILILRNMISKDIMKDEIRNIIDIRLNMTDNAPLMLVNVWKEFFEINKTV